MVPVFGATTATAKELVDCSLTSLNGLGRCKVSFSKSFLSVGADWAADLKWSRPNGGNVRDSCSIGAAQGMDLMEIIGENLPIFEEAVKHEA